MTTVQRNMRDIAVVLSALPNSEEKFDVISHISCSLVVMREGHDPRNNKNGQEYETLAAMGSRQREVILQNLESHPRRLPTILISKSESEPSRRDPIEGRSTGCPSSRTISAEKGPSSSTTSLSLTSSWWWSLIVVTVKKLTTWLRFLVFLILSSSQPSRRSRPRWHHALFIFILSFTNSVWARVHENNKRDIDIKLDPVRNFCRRWGHQAAIVDRRLYIDGGFINYNPLAQYPKNYTNTGLHYHELDIPGPGRMPQLYSNLSKPADKVPSVHGGALWADEVNKRLFLFGGEYPSPDVNTDFNLDKNFRTGDDEPIFVEHPGISVLLKRQETGQPPDEREMPLLGPPRKNKTILYSYDILTDEWVEMDLSSNPSGNSGILGSVAYGGWTSVSETGEGYFYGGWQSSRTVADWDGPPRLVSGLIKYRMDANHLSNHTGPDGVGRAEGALVFLPVGDGGMLVYFGGVRATEKEGETEAQPMEEVFLYDVLSSKWYVQNATGEVPPIRRRFCAGAAWPGDQSSYNIYLYGGAGFPPETSGYDDVYVLSIPSFQWIKLHPTEGGNVTGQWKHHSLSCNVVANAQMIIIGGWFPTTNDCDVPDQHGVHNADLGEQNEKRALWNIFDPKLTGYAVPSKIVSAIGGDASGGATKIAPDGGFSNTDLSVLMTRKANIPSRTPTRSIPTPTSTQPPEEKGPSLSRGAIAGMAIAGSIVLIALLVGIFYFIRRGRKRKTNPDDIFNNNNDSDKPAHDGAEVPEWSPRLGTSTPYTTHTPYSQSAHTHGPYLLDSTSIEPVELPVKTPPPIVSRPSPVLQPVSVPPAGATSWTAPDGVRYELMTPTGSTPGQHYVRSGSGHSGAGLSVRKHSPLVGAASGVGVGLGLGNSSPIESTFGTGTGTMGTTATSSSGKGMGNTELQTMVDSEGRLWVQVSAPAAAASDPGAAPASPHHRFQKHEHGPGLYSGQGGPYQQQHSPPGFGVLGESAMSSPLFPSASTTTPVNASHLFHTHHQQHSNWAGTQQQPQMHELSSEPLRQVERQRLGVVLGEQEEGDSSTH